MFEITEQTRHEALALIDLLERTQTAENDDVWGTAIELCSRGLEGEWPDPVFQIFVETTLQIAVPYSEAICVPVQ